MVTSLALGLVGPLWLIGVEVFLHFFDSYLSAIEQAYPRLQGTPVRNSASTAQGWMRLTLNCDEHHFLQDM